MIDFTQAAEQVVGSFSSYAERHQHYPSTLMRTVGDDWNTHRARVYLSAEMLQYKYRNRLLAEKLRMTTAYCEAVIKAAAEKEVGK